MENHKHEPIVTLDGQLKCMTCGKPLEEAQEEITSLGSRLGAKELLDHMAVDGGYSAGAYENGFIVFSREKDSITEEITIVRHGLRDYRIVKRYSVREVTH